MKKLTILGLLLTTVFLASCGSQPSANSEASETSSSETSTSSTVESEATTIFTGVIQEDATAGDSDTFQVFLNDIEAVDDQETIVPNFQTDGVILHVPQEAFSGEMADLVKGTKVQVTLQGLPIMTMSIPPQVPGNSIQTIEIIE
jgi:hypothetical protein